MNKKSKKLMLSIAKNGLSWIVSIIMLVPLILIVVNAFKVPEECLTLSFKFPSQITLENFTTVIEKGKLGRSFLNSFLYAGAATILTILFGATAAYFFARRQEKKSYAVYMYTILGIVIPINYVSLMKVMQVTQLNNSRIGIILLYTAMQIPFTIFLIYGFVMKIPRDLDEAAVIDGCGPIRLFFKIIAPMMRPCLVTAGVLCFLNTWNEFVMPLYFLNSSEKWPMTLAVYNFFGQYSKAWNLICADILLTCMPVIIIYLLCQKSIVGGQTAGAVKG